MEKIETWNAIVKEQCNIADKFIEIATDYLRLQTRMRFLCREVIEYLKEEGFEVILKDCYLPNLDIYNIYWENSTFGKAKKARDIVVNSQYDKLKACIKIKQKENPSLISIIGINCCYEVIRRIAEDGFDVEFTRNINNANEIYCVNLRAIDFNRKNFGAITEVNVKDVKVG